MNRCFITSCFLAALALACICSASLAVAQDDTFPNAKPMFVLGPLHPAAPSSPSGKHLVQWNGSFIDRNGAKQTFTMVGTDPSKTNVTTTTTVWVIPVKFVYDASHGNHTFDPRHKLSNGRTVIQNTLLSPLFNSGIDFKLGKVDLGNTQYEDAFQRGTWWGKNVKRNTKYHVLLKTVTKPEQTIHCTDVNCQVGTEFNTTIGFADINYYDNLIQGFMTKLGATPDIVPLFVWYDIYLTENNGQICCIGGYHNSNGSQPNGQTYNNAAYVDKVGAFSQDVSAMSHELGEWLDDPFGDNNVNCPDDNNVLEVGDPLENNQNFGTFPYKLNKFTYHLQSLVFVSYFGAPASDSVNKWFSFHNDIGICPGQ